MDASDGDLLSQAMEAFAAGNAGAAQTLFRSAALRDPRNAMIHHQLGVLSLAEGDAPSAVRHFTRATTLAPGEADFHNNLGVALNGAGKAGAACEAFRTAAGLREGFAEAVNNLGAALENCGDVMGAIAAYREALAIDPAYVQARDNLDLATAKSAPPWHFPMMADLPRNDAYEQALLRAAPGKRVLDIGSGSGLLAMMAARAGATCVDTCEAVEPVAQAARRVVAANGLEDRVTVHAKHSGRMEIGRDMKAPAEVLVTETFASGLLSEAVLPTLEHARRRLLTPDAQIIPRAAAARGYLVGGEAIEAHAYAPAASGFDLSPFDIFAPAKVGLHLDRIPHEVLSGDFEIFNFDLTASEFHAERRLFAVTATKAGRCIGVAQWLWLDMDGISTYENRPHGRAGANGWMHVFYRFGQAIDVVEAQEVVLTAGHVRTAMTVGLAV